MLIGLRIDNFAIVEAAELEFERGLTALTGETGAGKSLVVDALLLALGERAGADGIGAGMLAFDLLKKSELDIPFIFVSGTLGEQQAVEAMRAGARDYLLKGDMARLPEVVRREIVESKNRQAQRAAEEKAEADQKRIAMAVEASGLGFFEFSPDHITPISANERFAEIIGY